MTLDEMVWKLVISGVEVTMTYNKDSGNIEYDLNVHFKSGIKLTENAEGGVLALQRYGNELVEDIEDILYIYLKWWVDAAERWGDGKPTSMNKPWEDLMIEFGLVKKTVEVKEEVKYEW